MLCSLLDTSFAMRPLCASLIYVLAVLGLEAVMQKECEIVGILQDKLKYKERLYYMKYYFPLNYTVTVQYEEVLRTSNVSRLRDEAITEPSLRYLWFHVSSQVVLKIRDVLPEQHPSWSYTQELCDLLEGLGAEYEKYKQGDMDVVVADLVKRIHDAEAGSNRKPVRPKALLDNCIKVMRMLYSTPCRWDCA
uniref:Interleukin 34 n=1 Tax=Crocodylus porosus TaxID=8502 RepID=A0A7M4E0X3_CROPO